MNPLLLTMLPSLISLVESALPTLESAVSGGTITVEQQQAILNAYNSLKAKADGQFSGPAWTSL